MYNPISWHIEPTSRCTLACPGCDRTWYHKTFNKQIIEDIDIDDLGNFLQNNNFLGSHIRLCGNNGDPIYHPKFIELVSLLKSQNHTLSIHTNGSAKTSKFWKALCKVVTSDDKIVFAIDGLEDTNPIYRKNSNWKQIMEAIAITTQSSMQTEWQYIVFKHNQHQIETAKNLANKLGIDRFAIIKSHRWMDPSLNEYMPEQKFIDERPDIRDEVDHAMMPKCLTNQYIYIDSQGDIYPCCWTGTHRFKKKNAFGKTPLNISSGQYSLSQNKINFLNDSKSWNTASLVCKMHCAK